MDKSKIAIYTKSRAITLTKLEKKSTCKTQGAQLLIYVDHNPC
jgi:hypothetical protein